MTIETHILYFSEAEALREFSGFTVDVSHQARPNQTPSNVTMYMVVAQRGGIGRREVIAEFPLEMHATIFRDMCEGFVRSERLTK
ncbi:MULTISPECIES: hypothetical protein [Pseudomonas]|uniref:hypothetical protein n=1 Tax=Pseudomonas TaxID=286 RepID=UPI002E7C35C9|nr:hypothetical protein [Pseudomonas asiatica]MEE1919418.1 hypothetical protein [Pseudomonas asiatica]HCE6805127.1 hypothetical protein [Pseudomonas aeruginosa]